VIPAYNEGDNIRGVLQQLSNTVQTRPFEILVVYDFDEDTTVPVVERLRAEIPEVRLHRNRIGRGVLNALKAGFMAASAPYVVVMMADASDNPEDVDALVKRAEAGADVVAAARYMRGGRQIGGPRLKRLLSRTAGLSLHWLAGVLTHDPTNNFKLYSKRLLEQVPIESQAGFELALELTVKAHALGMRVEEVPTTWRDRTAGASRFRMWQWIPHYLRWYRYGLWSRLGRAR
jgi:glycosyltransferase involved in cell wall biosynthesis